MFKTYLPRFTLRRALIAIALLALFLGWLRPDRAKYFPPALISGIAFRPSSSRIVFYPIWPHFEIIFDRTVSIDETITLPPQP
jgi:hypothetical protein